MGKGRSVSSILKPLKDCPCQTYLGIGLHTLGLLDWILKQTGPADVYVSTFSTSDAFLSGFYRLRCKRLINHSVLIADLKASQKTINLYRLMQNCFDDVYLSMNHSKVVLVCNDDWQVAVISSQNQTYGDRAECTLVSTSRETFREIYAGLSAIVNDHSLQLNGLFNRLTERNQRESCRTDVSDGDIIPFGY